MKSTHCGDILERRTILHSAARSGSKTVVDTVLAAMDKLKFNPEEVRSTVNSCVFMSWAYFGWGVFDAAFPAVGRNHERALVGLEKQANFRTHPSRAKE